MNQIYFYLLVGYIWCYWVDRTVYFIVDHYCHILTYNRQQERCIACFHSILDS